MSRTEINPDDLSYNLRIDMTYIFNRQLLRVLSSAGTQYYESAIEGLQKILPLESRVNIGQQSDVWSLPKITWTFKAWCGHRLGSKNNPKVWDMFRNNMIDATERNGIIDPETKEINWDHPDIVSPTKKAEGIHVDYDKLLDVILTEAQDKKIIYPDQKTGAIEVIRQSKTKRRRTK